MLKELNYICFDFETTWMNFQKDEPIQIGIIKFNKNFKIIDKYKSYFKPQKNIKELKDIVSFITWLKLWDLENADYIEQHLDKIWRFFDKDTILIWHNVDFDINFLNKYLKIDYLAKIDTLDLSKTFMHFIPSHALEIIDDVLNEKTNYDLNWIIDDINYHDAFYDSIAVYRLFRYSIEHISQLIIKYPIIAKHIKQSNSIYNTILDLKKFKTDLKSSDLFLPPLHKEIKTTRKIINKSSYEFSTYSNWTKFYIWNIKLDKVLSNFTWYSTKLILSFASRSKEEISKNILEELWIKNLWNLYEEYVFNKINISKFLNKPSHEQFEINFLLKYYSQYNAWHSFLDLNNVWDYKVQWFLKENKAKKWYDICVTNHWNLYENILSKKLPKDCTIIMFDWDYWYSTYSKFINKPFDIYNIIYFIENLIYKYSFDKDTVILEELLKRIQIFIWVLFSELTEKFRNIQNPKIEINPILWDIDFYKSNNLYNNLIPDIKKITTIISESDLNEFKNLFLQLNEILESICTVEKKMYNEDEFYFLFYKNNTIINYHTFLDIFEWYNIYFMTNFDKDKSIKLNKNSELPNHADIIKKQSNTEELLNEIKWIDSIFILSTAKNVSKELFEKIFDKNIHNDYNILIENITWWLWKSLFYAKKHNKKIVIGWYEFMMSMISNKINFDKIFIYYTNWPLEKQIINDIYYIIDYIYW